MADLITKAFTEGGLYIVALVSCTGWIAFFWERKRHAGTTDKLFDVAGGSIEAMVKLEGAVNSVADVQNRLIDKM